MRARSAEFLTIIEEETDRLTQLIENMLESARLQSQTAKFRLQPVQLDSLVQDMIARVRVRNPALELHAEIEDVPPINGDAARLVQVLENLFGNALKYAPGSRTHCARRQRPPRRLVQPAG